MWGVPGLNVLELRLRLAKDRGPQAVVDFRSRGPPSVLGRPGGGALGFSPNSPHYNPALQELTDVETLGESEEGAAALVDGLLTGQLVGTLVQSMERMDETVKDESDAVHNSLAVVENVSCIFKYSLIENPVIVFVYLQSFIFIVFCSNSVSV